METRGQRTWAALLVGGAVLLILAGGRDGLVNAAIERAVLAALPDRSLLEDGDLHVFLCGTGIPAMDPANSACSAVVVAGELLMVDAGAGGIQQLTVDRVPVEALSTVLVTHLHSDHIGGLGDAIHLSVFRGRERPLTVYGPRGIEAVVDGFLRAYTEDTRLRSHPDGGFIDPAWVRPEVRTLAPVGDAPVAVLERDGLRVTAFAVDHAPVERALGFRIDHRGRAVAFSGDTRADPRLAHHARDVDILVHSAGVPRWMAEPAIPVLEAHGEARDAKLAAEGLRLFSSPVRVGEVASDARAGMLVFSHRPPVPTWAERIYLRGVGAVFDGAVVYGRDGMRFTLPPRR